jgi:hypothetical protein
MRRPLVQNIVFGIALICYAAAAACAVGAALYETEIKNDPIVASLMASVVFFIGCGAVLHVIGRARLRGLLSGVNDEVLAELEKSGVKID